MLKPARDLRTPVRRCDGCDTMPPHRYDYHTPSDFPDHVDENRRIWNANARWWDDRIGDGNDFQTLLIEPPTERLLNVTAGDTILDVACGAGRFARRMASLGATVVGIDTSSEFIARARERTPADASIEHRVVDAPIPTRCCRSAQTVSRRPSARWA